jgi:hypothetical protein
MTLGAAVIEPFYVERAPKSKQKNITTTSEKVSIFLELATLYARMKKQVQTPFKHTERVSNEPLKSQRLRQSFKMQTDSLEEHPRKARLL